MKKKLRLHQSVYGNVSQKRNYREEFLPDGEQETIDSKRSQFDKRAPSGSRLKNQGEVGDSIYQEDISEDLDQDGVDNELEEPDSDDCFISDSRKGGYDVSIEGKFLKHFDSDEEDEMEKFIKNWFKKNNVWYNVWYQDERGSTNLYKFNESEESEPNLEEGFLSPEDQLQVDMNRDELENERMDVNSKVVTSNELEDENDLRPLLDDEDEKELLYGMKESSFKFKERTYKKLKESIKRKSLYSEKEKFHRDSVIQLADQMNKYISKHEGNVNSVVNDITIGLFMAFSTYYKNDGDKETSGSDILKKVMKKLSSMITEYPELETGDLKDDFKLDDEELEDAGELPAEDGEEVNLEEEDDLEDEESLDEENEHEFQEDEEEMEEATPKKPVKKSTTEKVDKKKIAKVLDHITVKVEDELDFPDYMSEKYDEDEEGKIKELEKEVKEAEIKPLNSSEIKYFLDTYDVDYWGELLSELGAGEDIEESATDGTGSDSYNEEEDEEELEEEMIGSSLSGESETQPQIRADLPQNMNPYKGNSGKYKKKEYTKVYR